MADKKEFDKAINIKVRSTGRLLKAKINLENNYAKVEILDKEMEFHQAKLVFFILKMNMGIRF